ncbi:phosphoglycerate dehydrogenase [Streptomyces sp. NPDC127072]|uniref:phosphoglycerate dehydrogenase n=1 Tax=Streptomyces sp. NPDC127072 TaxID=3347129 RepID=UPI0036556F7D
MSRVLITTDYLRPGDEVDQYLKSAGLTTRHDPMTGPRDPEQLVSALAGMDAALIANEPFSADLLARAPQLKVVVRTGVGYDSVDVEAARGLGITVSNLPGVNANAVAEYTLGLLITSARRLIDSATGVAAGTWPREDGNELRGATLGLFGFGAAARAVLPLAQAFGMDVVCTTSSPESRRDDTGVRFVPFAELLATADYVSIHSSLTNRTRGLFDASAFARMKTTAILINTARGAIVDEHALAAAVRSGTIAGAALDVVTEEPMPAESPLRGIKGITVCSHLAGQTAQARRATGLAGAEELVAALEGRPRFAVT